MIVAAPAPVDAAGLKIFRPPPPPLRHKETQRLADVRVILHAEKRPAGLSGQRWSIYLIAPSNE